MPPGTTLITETIGPRPLRLSEKFLGRRGEFFVIESRRRGTDGRWLLASTDYYDLQGRLVRRDRKNGTETYKPYSCLYTTGECQHIHRYPNPFKNHRQTQNTRQYTSRLEGDELIVSWALVDGKRAEVPFRLGRYRLRVASEYRNRLGQEKGHRLIELIIPDE